ncbi:YbaN family protein [Aestuariibacter sp. AA17]|uniref:Inner membrane protein n=1 Tax=Fluctibacter corallii TaxID=2984329 RepID=A0ABT3A4M4_9ALTE|nr:YbaN family protein [Aestuariibacter sp. AA17]MCV2883558.1 YbaN family protein [Aestuariibacter sp. AA17]
MKKVISLVFAYLFLALALLGVFLPGLPTVPFLLLTAWFAARGSARLHQWLYDHPQLGKLLIDWEQQKAISRKSKYIAVLMLILSWGILYSRSNNMLLLTGLAVFFLLIAMFLVTRAEPK